MLHIKDEKDAASVNHALIGPPQVDRPTVVDEKTGIVPPAWWKGDEFASQSSMAGMLNFKR